MSPSNQAFSALLERIVDNGDIDAETLSSARHERGDVQTLLQMARVIRQIENNAGGRKDCLQVNHQQLGVYRLIRLLGSGGMGEVWLAERGDGAVEHCVAIKRVHGSISFFSARMDVERRLLAKLSHPNVARFIDAGGDERGLPWLAMEYIDGSAITDWCAQHRVGLRQRIELFRQVCAAVEHAHRHLIVHRDIKPNNVFVNADGQAKLLDFGIAKLLDESRSSSQTIGLLTPSFASPEQLRGEEISTASDVYSLGLLLFRLLAGVLPETRLDGNASSVLAQLEAEQHQRPSRSMQAQAPERAQSLSYSAQALEGDLDAIVAQAIRLPVDARYSSVGAFSDDLLRYLDGQPVRARVPTRIYRFSRWLRRNQLVFGISVAAFLGLSATTGLAIWQARQAQAETLKTKIALQAAAEAKQRANQSKHYLIDLFSEISPQLSKKGVDLRAVEWIAQSMEALDANFAQYPALRGELRTTFVGALWSLGQEAESLLPMAELAINEIRSQRRGAATSAGPENGLELGNALKLKGVLLRESEQFAPARDFLEQALAQFKSLEQSPQRDLEIERSYATLGVLATRTGDYEAAYQTSRNVLALRRARVGEMDPSLLVLFNNFGSNAMMLGHIAEASQAFDAAHRLMLRHPETPTFAKSRILWARASCLLLQEEFGQAKLVAEQARALSMQALGANAWQSASIEIVEASALFRMGQHTAANTILMRILPHLVESTSTSPVAQSFYLRRQAEVLMALNQDLESGQALQSAMEKLKGTQNKSRANALLLKALLIEREMHFGRSYDAAKLLGIAAEMQPLEQPIEYRDLARLIARVAQHRADPQTAAQWTAVADALVQSFRAAPAVGSAQ